MDRIDKIINNEDFKEYLKKIKKLERERLYCKHGMKHFLDVARIAYILNLENNLVYTKEVIYATALLHDIGKWMQYEDKIPHELASAKLCEEILDKANFSNDEIRIIREAILKHRTKQDKVEDLNSLLYFADKISRACYSCKVNDTCNWDDNKKNHKLKY